MKQRRWQLKQLSGWLMTPLIPESFEPFFSFFELVNNGLAYFWA